MKKSALLKELEKLVDASIAGNYNVALDEGALSGEDAQIAGILNAVIRNYSASVQYDLLKYRLTREALGIGMWDMEVNTGDPVNPGNTFIWSQEMREMLGYSDENELPNILAAWIDRIHPDDKEMTVGLFEEHLKDRSGKIKLDGEYRLKLKDGSYKYFHAFGTTLRDKEGNAIIVAGAIEDIDKKKQMQEAIKQRERMLNALNDMSITLLAHEDKDFQNVISEGIKSVASVAGLDRIAVYRNLDGRDKFGQIYLWYGKSIPLDEELVVLPDIPPVQRWLEILKQNKCINGNVNDMPQDEKEFLDLFTVKAIFFVPVFVRDELWGIITLEDHSNYRYFEESILDLLSSAAHLCASAVIRNEMQMQVDDANRLNNAMLASTPIGMVLYNEELKIINCNEVISKMFAADKERCIANFFDFIPECQPNGEKSRAMAERLMRRALDGNDITCEWMHINKDGKEIPCEVTLTRILIGGKYIGLAHTYDISNIKKLSEELKDALEQATVASRAKGDFLSNISHEMRTPLNAIIGMTAIGKKAGDLVQKDRAFNKISDASSHLLGIINDVLDMAKIEADKLELSYIEFGFEGMLEKILAVINFRAEEKNIKLNLKIDKNIPRYIIGDDQRLSQVITNLLSNAVKFTSENGRICLEASLLNETDGICCLEIKVSDNGIGISSEQQSKLFKTFVQADSSTSRNFGGTGLGLAISKRIVGMMDGDIWVQSEPGKGACFTFTVKVRRGRKNDAALDETGKREILADEFAGKRMLIAEDIEINREILLTLLEGTGLVIDCVEDGEQAYHKIKTFPARYDIIFMDVQMPKMDGLEATRLIREFEKSLPEFERQTLQSGMSSAEGETSRYNGDLRRQIPIIAMTANVFKSDIETCKKAGMNDHLGKPIDIDKVLEVLRKYLL